MSKPEVSLQIITTCHGKNEATAQLLHFKRQWAQHVALILCLCTCIFSGR